MDLNHLSQMNMKTLVGFMLRLVTFALLLSTVPFRSQWLCTPQYCTSLWQINDSDELTIAQICLCLACFFAFLAVLEFFIKIPRVSPEFQSKLSMINRVVTFILAIAPWLLFVLQIPVQHLGWAFSLAVLGCLFSFLSIFVDANPDAFCIPQLPMRHQLFLASITFSMACGGGIPPTLQLDSTDSLEYISGCAIALAFVVFQFTCGMGMLFRWIRGGGWVSRVMLIALQLLSLICGVVSFALFSNTYISSYQDFHIHYMIYMED